jgi:beta-glucosidase/6-phospho-beta-glucosidase/beta-galactosidase
MTDSHADRSNLRGYDAWSFLDDVEWHRYRRLIADHTDLVRAEQRTSTR